MGLYSYIAHQLHCKTAVGIQSRPTHLPGHPPEEGHRVVEADGHHRLWRERVQGKGSKWRSASRRRQLQTRSSHHGVMPNPPPLPFRPFRPKVAQLGQGLERACRVAQSCPKTLWLQPL